MLNTLYWSRHCKDYSRDLCSRDRCVVIVTALSSLKASRAVTALLLVTLASCTYLPETSSTMPAGWQDTVHQRNQITSWKVRGRLGVQTETDGGSLDLYWKQDGEAYTIRLIAPLGQGTVLIKGDASGVSIRTAEGEQFAHNADALMLSSLGIDMPVKALRNWLRGLPLTSEPVKRQRWDSQGQLAGLVQAHWNVEISQYQQVGDYILPHAFYLERDDRPELAIRLLIHEWRTGPA